MGVQKRTISSEIQEGANWVEGLGNILPVLFAAKGTSSTTDSVIAGAALLLAGARVRDVEPVPVARPTRELGVGD